jgi:lantibiotic modifying enzyme
MDHKKNACLWYWHGKGYFGAAHGVAGIVTVLANAIFSPIAEHETISFLFGKEELIPILCDTTEWLLRAASLSSDNFNSSFGSNSDCLVQFCHGAPGIVLLAVQMLGHLTFLMDQMIEQFERIVALRKKLWSTVYNALERCIWQRGLLRKEMGLCHGISGNGYTFLFMERYLAYEQKFFEDSHSSRSSHNQGKFLLSLIYRNG